MVENIWVALWATGNPTPPKYSCEVKPTLFVITSSRTIPELFLQSIPVCKFRKWLHIQLLLCIYDLFQSSVSNANLKSSSGSGRWLGAVKSQGYPTLPHGGAIWSHHSTRAAGTFGSSRDQGGPRQSSDGLAVLSSKPSGGFWSSWDTSSLGKPWHTMGAQRWFPWFSPCVKLGHHGWNASTSWESQAAEPGGGEEIRCTIRAFPCSSAEAGKLPRSQGSFFCRGQ